MKNIVLARVDDRLIHGQVLSGWVPKYRANVIFIVDDEIAKDKLTKRILKASVPGHIKLSIYSVSLSAEILQGKPETAKERILLLAKSPIPFYQLMEAGCSLPAINLGGMGMFDDRQPFFRNLSCNDEEKQVLKKLLDRDTELFYQLVPDQKRYDMKKILEENTN